MSEQPIPDAKLHEAVTGITKARMALRDAYALRQSLAVEEEVRGNRLRLVAERVFTEPEQPIADEVEVIVTITINGARMTQVASVPERYADLSVVGIATEIGKRLTDKK